MAGGSRDNAIMSYSYWPDGTVVFSVGGRISAQSHFSVIC